ncbi:9350_t:CDS:2 [Gigaspora rosea]|nr:9350_t:CDS:2 [Gigaspora rosea]
MSGWHIITFLDILHAIKRYIKLELNIESGEDITSAIENIAGTLVASLIPN